MLSICSIKCQNSLACIIRAQVEIGLLDIYLDLHLVQEVIKTGYINTDTQFGTL